MAVYFLIPKSDGTEEILSRRARSLHETELEIDVHDTGKTLLIREENVHEVQSNTEIITQGGTNSTALCYSGTGFIKKFFNFFGQKFLSGVIILQLDNFQPSRINFLVLTLLSKKEILFPRRMTSNPHKDLGCDCP